jgi:hypothetical protein
MLEHGAKSAELNFHNDDRTGRPSKSRIDLNVALAEGLILENRWVAIRDFTATLELCIGV